MTEAAPELSTAGITLVGGGAMLTEYVSAGVLLVALGTLSYVLVARGTRMRGAVA